MASARQVVVNIATLVLQTVHLLLIVMSWMEEVIILLLRMESFYEIEADLSFGVTEGTNIAAKKNTKVGSYDSSTTSWELVFDGSPASTNYKITMPFTVNKTSKVGSIRAFYISLQAASILAWEQPGVQISNSDAIIFLAEILAQQINDEIPGTLNFGSTHSFLGGLNYNYEQTTSKSPIRHRQNLLARHLLYLQSASLHARTLELNS